MGARSSPGAEIDAAVRASLRKRQADELQRIDAEVKAHEAAHVAALGGGAASYTYVLGPDGTRYAVGGSVAVDLKEVPGDPEATIQKAKAAIRAAYAVGQPSGADMRVAAEAYVMEMKAQRELEESRGAGGRDGNRAGGRDTNRAGDRDTNRAGDRDSSRAWGGREWWA